MANYWYINQTRILPLILAVLIGAFFTTVKLPAQDGVSKLEKNRINLAGDWNFRLDPDTLGISERWYTQVFDEHVFLPGTTDENKKGIYLDERRDDRLSRIWYWKGAAWYQKKVVIPEEWSNKRIILFLERTKEIKVWVDGTYVGNGNSLSTPHHFDISAPSTPGEHVLTVLVDNSILPPVGPAHAVDERTQTNWNGIVGRMEMEATDQLFIEDIQAYPDTQNDRVTLDVVVGNVSDWGGFADLIIQASTLNKKIPVTYQKILSPVLVDGRRTHHKIQYHFDKDYPLWDEFDPSMIELSVSILSQPGVERIMDTKVVAFGMRSFRSGPMGFTINGKGIFLRGSHDACIFPLTGYAPMEKEEWLRILGIAKSYGINHYRFHSWCPPEAAFAAADELGMYLQPELPNKADFGKPEHDEYLRKEGELILQAYGNHPSFVMFTLGNELGRNQHYYDFVDHYRKFDPRHLYAQGSNNENYPGGDLTLAEGDDFWVTSQTGDEYPVRGSFYQGDYAKGHIDFLPPSTLVDYGESIVGLAKPVVGHETGQFQVSPDFSDIGKFTGVLKARNYEIFRERLKEKNMLEQSDDFVKASGALSVICYREDIEAALRTKHLGGFQLLDLHDFTGQGTAPVGMLNVFMESKGLITPEKWREFCSEVVPLLRMEKYVWTVDDNFIGAIEVSNFGPGDFPNGVIEWKVKNDQNKTLFSGKTEAKNIKQGRLCELGLFTFPLKNVKVPQKLTIEMALPDTKYVNHYDIWVYDSGSHIELPKGVMIRNEFTTEVIDRLNQGEKVLLFPDPDQLPNSIKGSFQCDFWCFPMFRRAALKNNVEVAPGTLGILCDPTAPALSEFPTEFHSNWQWWQLVKNSRPVILDTLPADFQPIVQVIDNFWRNHKLGIVFEMKVGKGKLLVCSIDLLGNQDKPEVRQFYRSLLHYAASPEFSPKKEIRVELMKTLFNTSHRK